MQDKQLGTMVQQMMTKVIADAERLPNFDPESYGVTITVSVGPEMKTSSTSTAISTTLGLAPEERNAAGDRTHQYVWDMSFIDTICPTGCIMPEFPIRQARVKQL